MDNVKKEKIKHLKGLMATVFNILDDIDDDKAIDFIQKQHQMTESTLIELGALDPDEQKNKVKELHEHIREIEKKLGEQVSESHIAGYLIDLESKFKDNLESDYGIEAYFNINFSAHGFSVSVDYPKKITKLSYMDFDLYNSDDEVNQENERLEEFSKKSNDFFSFYKDNESIPFTEKNTESLKTIVTNIVCDYMKYSTPVQFDIQTSLAGIKKPFIGINKAKLQLSCSETAKALHKSFKDY